MQRGVVIIGAGHGGSQVGFSLRQEGYDGPIHLVSDEPDLPYHKPPLSKAYLKDVSQDVQILRAEKAYADARIELALGREVEAIDRQARAIRFTDGAMLPYDRLVIATGATNRKLALPGHDLAGLHSIRTRTDAAHLREAMQTAGDIVVIGGGFIGLEAAATFAALGKRVTVIELAPSILGRAVSSLVAAHVDAEYRKLGIRVLTATGIERLEGEAGKVKAVRLSDGSAIPADLVLVGIGATPNDALARDAGLACDNGIVVDATLATADPTIFAVGDVTNFPHAHAGRRVRLESVQNASDQAKHVAKTIMGKPDDYRETPWFWSDQGHMKLQMAGLSFGADRHVRTGALGEPAFSVYHYAGDRLLAVDSVNRPGDHMVARRLIAAGISPSEADLSEGPDRLKSLIGR